jgi:hypothetical protein
MATKSQSLPGLTASGAESCFADVLPTVQIRWQSFAVFPTVIVGFAYRFSDDSHHPVL